MESQSLLDLLARPKPRLSDANLHVIYRSKTRLAPVRIPRLHLLMFRTPAYTCKMSLLVENIIPTRTWPLLL